MAIIPVNRRLSLRSLRPSYLIGAVLIMLTAYVGWQAYEQFVDQPLPPEAISSVRLQIDTAGLQQVTADLAKRRPTETR